MLRLLSRVSVLTTVLGLSPLGALAQPVSDNVTVIHPEVHLAGAVVSGVILALAFQLIFTLISLAGGISLVPDLRKLSAKHKADRLAAGHPLHLTGGEDDHAHTHASSRAAVNSVGVWVLGTTAIALFGATSLAMRLSFLGTDEYRDVLALVVWATYFTLITYVEWKMAKSLAGGLLSVALAGLHLGKDALSALLHKSPEARLEDFGKHTLSHIYHDLSKLTQESDIDGKLSRFLRDVKPRGIDYDRIHDEVARILTDAKKETGVDANIEDFVGKLSKRLEQPHPIFTAGNAFLLYSAVRRASETARGANRSSDGLFGFADAFAPLPDEQVKALRQKIEDFLAKTHREELDPEAIRKDIEAIIADPGSSLDVIGARLSHFNMDSLKAIATQSGIVDAAQADAVISKVMAAKSTVQQKYQDTTKQASQFGEQAHRAADAASDKLNAGLGAGKEFAQSLPKKFEDRIQAYLDSFNAPEVNFNLFKADIMDILHHPSDAPEIIRERLSTFDASTLEGALQANPWIPAAQIRSAITTIEQTRDELLKRLEVLESRAVGILEQNRRRAAIAAEHAREAAASAAWWLVCTAVASAGATLLGAYASTYSF